MRVFLCIFLSTILSSSLLANYTTPGTGATYTLNNLVANAGGDVAFVNGEYFVNDTITISVNDILSISTDETVKFAPNVLLDIKGNVSITPPNGVIFTAQDPTLGFRGMRLDFSTNSVLQKLTYEYASALRINDCSPTLSDCIIRYNGASTVLGSSAITMFRAKPIIKNCQFIQNRRAAISGGGNIANAPVITGSLFLQNNMLNLNVPQINLGGTGMDTAKIINCQIIGGNTNSGGIGLFPFGIVGNLLIKQNLIKGNRFGITLIGGSLINAVVSYNRIADNNIQNDPILGGSGIAFSGGAAGNFQNTIVTGNVFERNLWGITILSQSGGIPFPGARPNLGNLNNADTSDDGKNRFINNTNSATPGTDLYNNSSDPIFAMGNYWNTSLQAAVESKIFHQPDNPALGLVNYSRFFVPVELLEFTVQSQRSNGIVQWRTAREMNSSFFVIERSEDSLSFEEIHRVPAAGNSNTETNYNYTDVGVGAFGGTFFYRLRMVDIDSTQQFSPIVKVEFGNAPTRLITNLYPTVIRTNDDVIVEFASYTNQVVGVQYIDAQGKLLKTEQLNLSAGFNRSTLRLPSAASGWIALRFTSQDNSQTFRVLQLPQ